jgi:hypothetical protein
MELNYCRIWTNGEARKALEVFKEMEMQMVQSNSMQFHGKHYLELVDGIKILRELVDDNSHKQSNEIQQELKKIYNEMIEYGYIPNTNFVTLHDMNEEEKEHHLCSHSEKLAIGLGLINTSSWNSSSYY